MTIAKENNQGQDLNFMERRALMFSKLSKKENVDVPYQKIISKLYEELTGLELVRETDPENGEDYFYKGDEHSTSVSIGLHDEVVNFFGFSNRYMKGKSGGYALEFYADGNLAIARYLSENVSNYFEVLH